MTGEKNGGKKPSRLVAACEAEREDAKKKRFGSCGIRPVSPQLIYSCLALILDEAEYGLAALNIVRYGEALKRIMPLAEEALEACETLMKTDEIEAAMEDVEQERRRKAARRKAIYGGKAR